MTLLYLYWRCVPFCIYIGKTVFFYIALSFIKVFSQFFFHDCSLKVGWLPYGVCMCNNPLILNKTYYRSFNKRRVAITFEGFYLLKVMNIVFCHELTQKNLHALEN